MNDSYIEAQESIRNDEYQGDREREREREEDRFEEMTIMEKMDHIMKEAQELSETFKECDKLLPEVKDIDEKQEKYYWDSKFAI